MNIQLQKNDRPKEDYTDTPLDDTTNYLFTRDLGAAASLVTAGFELVALDKTLARKVQFIFRREVGIETVAEDYWADRLQLKSRSFFDNVKMLKNRIYSE